jgi:hypothetical protein
MLSHVEFRSNAFPAYESEEEEINPGRYGKRLAEFLSDGLKNRGEPVEELIPEDWGWIIPITNPDFNLWIGVGNYEEYPDGFLCFIEPHKEYIRKLFKKIHVADRIAQLRENIDAVVTSSNDIRDIKWWTHDESNNPSA